MLSIRLSLKLTLTRTSIKMSWLSTILWSLLVLFVISFENFASATNAHSRVKRVVGGHQAKAPPPDDPVVFARIYNRDARVEGFRNTQTGVYSFLGMYYAEPPIGKLRYSRPVYKRLSGDVNATRHGPPCLQPDQRYRDRVIGDENCLLMNVYTPQMPDETTGLPVLFWIHPGGYQFGSAAQYDGSAFAQQRAIVVTPQYRLGSLGIIGDGSKEFDGNLAMFDLAAALQWVKDYIKEFGGNPQQITPIGHGSGGTGAMYLSMSRNARSAGDVSGVIAMSGTALTQYSLDREPDDSGKQVAEVNGCPSGDEIEFVSCMRKKSAEEIIQNDSKIQMQRLADRAIIKGLTGGTSFNPHLEQPDDNRGLPALIVGEPEEQLRKADFKPIPLMTGCTKHETGRAISIESLNKTFGNVQEFLGSLIVSLTDLKGLLRFDQLKNEVLKPVLPGLTEALTPTLDQVLRLPQTLNLDTILMKVIESTTDILFNLPAVLTTQLWSAIAPSYMYSFEYHGNTSRGRHFLQGLQIVAEDSRTTDELVTHGDELGYLFDANDIFGNPIEEARLSSAEDLKVRNNLIGMMVQFAESFNTETKPAAIKNGVFQAAGEKGSYIKINTELKPENDFRFCELSVLGAPLTALSQISCSEAFRDLTPVTDVLNNAVGGLTGTLGNLTAGLTGGSRGTAQGAQGGLLGLGLLGGRTTTPRSAPNRRQPGVSLNILG